VICSPTVADAPILLVASTLTACSADRLPIEHVWLCLAGHSVNVAGPTALPLLDTVAVIELASAVLQIQIEYVTAPPGRTFDWPAICALTQMTAAFCDGLGLGGLEPLLVGVFDGVWLGVDVLLCDGLGVSDGLASPERATAENTAADPVAHGEWADLACREGAIDAASAGASAEPDNKNAQHDIKAAARLARTIPIDKAVLR
jgi:hypothetical protein